VRDLDLMTLRLFVYVCESGSMTRASERANIVGSAISKRLAQLEDHLGTTLLVRKGQGVAPTAAGQTLLEHARSMLDSTARIERDMHNFAAGARGQVRLIASQAAICERLAQDVADFLVEPRNKAIHVDLEERITPDIVRGVHEGLASLGVCWDAADLAGLQSRPYCTDHFCVVVPRRHPLAGKRTVRLADTLDYEQVGLPVNSATHVLLQRAAAGLGRTLQHRVIVASFETMVRVVSARAVIGIAPFEVAEPMAEPFNVKLLTLDEPWAQRRFVTCFRDIDALSPSALLLLEHLSSAGAG
jgi:DNA-binding transcriptional LysR family regulator